MGQWWEVGRLWVGWSAHKGSPPPFLEVGHPGACPWGVVHSEGPCTVVLRCKANLSHWRGRQFTFWLPLHSSSPDLIRVHPYKGDAIMSVLHGVIYLNQQVSNVAAGFLYVPPDLKAAYRVIPLGNDWGVLAGGGRGRCWGSPTEKPYPFPIYQHWLQRRCIQS